MLELRGNPRLSTTLPVALRFPDTENPEGWGRIVDLSPTGVRLETRWPLKVGESVYLTFIPTHELRLENLRAQVLRVDWEDGYYIGGMIFDASVDQNYLKDALVALMTKS